MFESALRDVLTWIDRTKKALSEDVRALDVQQAEDLLKKHYELGEQIKDKNYEVCELLALIGIIGHIF